MTRKEKTTEHLRDVGCGILAKSGARAFTQEALAREGYASIGSVYARWPSKTDTLRDLFDTRVLPELRRISTDDTVGTPWHGAETLLDSAAGRRALQLAVEVLWAARDDIGFARDAGLTIEALERTMRFTATPGDEGLDWWLTCLAVGWGLLLSGDFSPPPLARDLLDVLCTLPGPRSSGSNVSAAELPTIPPTPSPVETDDTGQAVKRSVRELLATGQASEMNTRTISTTSHVSISALYRRFPSRSELLRSILVDELQSDRYSWTNNLVEAATTDRALDAVVDIIFGAMRRVYDNTEEQTFLLEITTAARVDPVVRQQLTSQISSSVEARTRLFDRLREAGFVTQGMAGDALAWIFQAPPIGARLLGALGHRPSDQTMRAGIRRVCLSLLTADAA